MNITRRSILSGAAAVGASAAIQGCHIVPTEEKMYKIGMAFGGAAGLVLDQCDLEDEVRNRIVEIVGKCRTVAPQEGETVWDAWMRTAKAHVKELVDAGKVSQLQGDLIIAGFSLVVKGLQLLVAKHPEVGTYGALAIAAVGGFCDGFLAVYRPADGECPECCEGCTVDVMAVKELQRSAELGNLRVKAYDSRPYPSRREK